MTLSELISAYGDDKVKLQNLDHCAEILNYNHKKGTKITFRTDIALGANGTREMGLVVWMDRDRVAEILASAQPKEQS